MHSCRHMPTGSELAVTNSQIALKPLRILVRKSAEESDQQVLTLTPAGDHVIMALDEAASTKGEWQTACHSPFVIRLTDTLRTAGQQPSDV